MLFSVQGKFRPQEEGGGGGGEGGGRVGEEEEKEEDILPSLPIFFACAKFEPPSWNRFYMACLNLIFAFTA